MQKSTPSGALSITASPFATGSFSGARNASAPSAKYSRMAALSKVSLRASRNNLPISSVLSLANSSTRSRRIAAAFFMMALRSASDLTLQSVAYVFSALAMIDSISPSVCCGNV